MVVVLASALLLPLLFPIDADAYAATADERAQWAQYTGIAAGPLFNAEQNDGTVITCGYFNPGSAPSTRYTMDPGAALNGCNDDSIANFNAPRYWTRPVDLPFGKFWALGTMRSYSTSPDISSYQNCPPEAPGPMLASGFPIQAWWGANVAVSPVWQQYLQARNLDQSRLFDADVCIRIWPNSDRAVRLKVTDVCTECDHLDLKVEANQVFLLTAPNPMVWRFEKCWDALMQPRFFPQTQTPGHPLQRANNPIFKGCVRWSEAAFNAQADQNQLNDAWFRAARRLDPSQQDPWIAKFGSPFVPHVWPRDSSGNRVVVLPDESRIWGDYTQIVLGRRLSGPPDVVACGFFNPATAPEIIYAEYQLGVEGGCPASHTDPSLSTYNPARYWSNRFVDLPMNKYWEVNRMYTYDVPDEPFSYLDCDVPRRLPTLSSGIPFLAWWKQNIGVSPVWEQWLSARGINPDRLYDADVCVSIWMPNMIELTLKVTDVCQECGPTDLKVEPYQAKAYLNVNHKIWTFTKCWGHLMAPRYYPATQTPGTALNKYNSPPLKSCRAWSEASTGEQYRLNERNDLWCRAAVLIPEEQRQFWSQLGVPHVPSIWPSDSQGNNILYVPATGLVQYSVDLFLNREFGGFPRLRLTSTISSTAPFCQTFPQLSAWDMNDKLSSLYYTIQCPAGTDCNAVVLSTSIRLYSDPNMQGDSVTVVRGSNTAIMCNTATSGQVTCRGYVRILPSWFDNRTSSLAFCIRGADAASVTTSLGSRRIARTARALSELRAPSQTAANAAVADPTSTYTVFFTLSP